MCRMDEERANRLQAEHEAVQAAKARQRAEEKEQQRLRMVAILDQQVTSDILTLADDSCMDMSSCAIAG